MTDDDTHTPMNRLLLCGWHDVGRSEGQRGRAAGEQHPGAKDSDAFCGWVALQQSKSLLNVIPKDEWFKSWFQGKLKLDQVIKFCLVSTGSSLERWNTLPVSCDWQSSCSVVVVIGEQVPDTGVYSPLASVSNRDRLDLAILDDELLPTGSKLRVPVRKFI